MKSYINVYPSSNGNLTHYYIEDSIKKKEIIQYKPIRGFKVDFETEWCDIYDNYLQTKRFDSMSECNKWCNDNKYTFDIYGDISHTISFISENYEEEITLQKSQINIFAIDIETYSESGKFSKAENDNDIINAITFLDMNTRKYYIYGIKDYTPETDDTIYVKCDNEKILLQSIIKFFNHIDIVTGWYLPFDIPYIIDRIEKVLGKGQSKKLSPNNYVRQVKTVVNKRQVNMYDISGVIIMDYLDLYKKFTYDNKDSYSLDNISKLELGNSKLEYKSEYSSLNDLYDNDSQKFYSYNRKDVELILLLDDKLKFIDIGINYAYMMKCNIDDIFGTVKPWDALLYYELYKQNKLCSPQKTHSSSGYDGAYVKEPKRGLIGWTTIYDIVSSYPNQLISFDMGPETLVPQHVVHNNADLEYIVENFRGVERCLNIEQLSTITDTLKKYNMSYTVNGQFFYNDKKSFIATIVSKIFQKRLAIKSQLKQVTDEGQRKILDSINMVYKIAINSCYGFLGCNYGRYYDTKIAEAITMQGQLCARGIATYIEKKHDLEWIYQDTDSMTLDLTNLIQKRFGNIKPDNKTILDFVLKYQDKILQPSINEYFINLGKILNVKKMTVEMEHECISDKAIFVEKKNYVMHQVYKEGKNLIDKPKYKIKGMAVIKTAAYPEYTRSVMRKIIELIIETENNNLVIDCIKNFKNEFYKASPDKISSPTSISMKGNRTNKITGEVTEIELTIDSVGLPKQVRAAFVHNEALKILNLEDKYTKIQDGNKIRLVNIKQPNIFKSPVIGYIEKMPIEFLQHIKIDYDEQWDKTFKKPIVSLLNSIGYSFENVINLDSFFD